MNKKTIGLLLISALLFLCFSVLAQAVVVAANNVVMAANSNLTINVNYNILGRDDPSSLKNLGCSKVPALCPTLTFTSNNTIPEQIHLETSAPLSGYSLNLFNTTHNALTALDFNLTPGSSVSYTLNVTAPLSANSGSHQLGKLKVNNQEYFISILVEPMLKIDRLEANVDGTRDTLSNGDTIKKVRPGKEVTLTFRIKDLFNTNYDNGDISDVLLNVQLKNSNDDSDLGQSIDEEDNLDLTAGESSESIIKFTIPSEAREKNYDLLITLDGVDDNGAKSLVTWTVSLDVYRAKDDVQIETAYLINPSVKCARDAQLKVTLTNFGRNTQKTAGLGMYSKDLGINDNSQTIYLDKDPEASDNSFSKTIPISLTPDFKAGIYPIEIRAFINGDKQIAYQEVKLTVEDCPAAKPADTTPSNQNDTVVVISGAGQPQNIVAPPAVIDSEEESITETTETSFTEISGIVIFMSVIGVLVLILIILVIFVLVRKRN